MKHDDGEESHEIRRDPDSGVSYVGEISEEGVRDSYQRRGIELDDRGEMPEGWSDYYGCEMF